MTADTLDHMRELAEQAEDALIGLLKHCTAFPSVMVGDRVQTALQVAERAALRRYPNVVPIARAAD